LICSKRNQCRLEKGSINEFMAYIILFYAQTLMSGFVDVEVSFDISPRICMPLATLQVLPNSLWLLARTDFLLGLF
jgi:hypothetical protein